MFFYSRDRTGEPPQAHLATYAGIFQADAYGGYNKLYEPDRKPGPILEAACWVGLATGFPRRHTSSRTTGGRICHPSRLAVAHLNLKLSRLSWSTDRQPISFMSRSISARRFSSALSTPA